MKVHESALLAGPQLTSRASSGRAWRLRAARHSQEEVCPLGAQPLPRVLERAASKAAVITPLTLILTLTLTLPTDPDPDPDPDPNPNPNPNPNPDPNSSPNPIQACSSAPRRSASASLTKAYTACAPRCHAACAAPRGGRRLLAEPLCPICTAP